MLFLFCITLIVLINLFNFSFSKSWKKRGGGRNFFSCAYISERENQDTMYMGRDQQTSTSKIYHSLTLSPSTGIYPNVRPRQLERRDLLFWTQCSNCWTKESSLHWNRNFEFQIVVYIFHSTSTFIFSGLVFFRNTILYVTAYHVCKEWYRNHDG
jgi:hypothetical protein